MFEIPSILDVPVPLKVPLVAPVTARSPAVSVVESSLKVKVSSVVYVIFDTPFAVRPVNAIGNASVTKTIPQLLVVILLLQHRIREDLLYKEI